MKNEKTARENAIVAASGLCWPTQSRPYLINLVGDAVREAQKKSKVIMALLLGHTVDGKYLERELKARIKNHLASIHPRLKGDDLESEKYHFERDFVEEYASQLAEFLPMLDDVNWHIAIAERIYDRPLGAKIIERLRAIRSDVRIIGERLEDGFYDREPKIPVQFPGVEDVRALVPHRSPWFSKVITNQSQRISNAFSPRTLSPRPSLILIGATGTSSHLPMYDGVPNISVPDLRKLLEQQSTENMIGASVIRFIPDGRGRTRIINGVHNFRTAAFLEKQVAVSSALPTAQRAVMHALVPSDASFKAINYRVNANKKLFSRKKDFREVAITKAIDELTKTGEVVFSKKSNRFGINAALRRNASITLASLWEGSRSIKHVVYSCVHGGALKTLYFTLLKLIPELAVDADAIIENGDLVQGISHNYQTNGELLPIANGVDKQEMLNAHLRATILLDVFQARLQAVGTVTNASETLTKCLVKYVFNVGNHDEWGFWNKSTLILNNYEGELRACVTEGVMRICQEQKLAVTIDQVKQAVDTSIIRVGESRMVELDGITVGIKHPYKSRTETKSTRIQQVADFLWRRFDVLRGTLTKVHNHFSIAYVANFHEAATAHITKWGQTVLGVMTGAFMMDTTFETHMDKVIDHGPAVVTARFDKEGRLLYSETEYVTRIDEEDRVFVTADRLDSTMVLQRCVKLLERIKLKLWWR